MSNSDFGKLIWPKFYGPKVENRKNNIFSDMLPIFIFAIIVLTIISGFLLIRNPDNKVYFGVSVLWVVFIVFSIIFLILILRIRKDRFYILRDNGLLEWDLFENGFLIKHYSENAIGNVEERFISYNKIARAIIDPDEKSIQLVNYLLDKAEHVNYISSGEKNKIIDNNDVEFIKNCIWFLDIDGQLIDVIMEKDHLEDLKKFKTFLNKKIKQIN